VQQFGKLSGAIHPSGASIENGLILTKLPGISLK
jgi:hypothetical protein